MEDSDFVVNGEDIPNFYEEDYEKNSMSKDWKYKCWEEMVKDE